MNSLNRSVNFPFFDFKIKHFDLKQQQQQHKINSQAFNFMTIKLELKNKILYILNLLLTASNYYYYYLTLFKIKYVYI